MAAANGHKSFIFFVFFTIPEKLILRALDRTAPAGPLYRIYFLAPVLRYWFVLGLILLLLVWASFTF